MVIAIAYYWSLYVGTVRYTPVRTGIPSTSVCCHVKIRIVNDLEFDVFTNYKINDEFSPWWSKQGRTFVWPSDAAKQLKCPLILKYRETIK